LTRENPTKIQKRKEKRENMLEEDKETRKKKTKVFTLLLVVDDENEQVLLGEKKTGFGKGFWNGFGGKVEESDPTVLAAALRELEEEACIQALDAKEIGRITFIWIDEPEKPPWLVHIFRADTYSGQERETEEMRPRWFPFDAIPFQQMWADDQHWYPLVLNSKRKNFEGTFNFKEVTTLVDFELNEVQSLSMQ
jgi:8-oxo-dGTP pyrophosphatase MutT (NUDIX family)